MLRVACPTCARSYQITDQSLGSRAQCKSCGHAFTLAIASDESNPATLQGSRSISTVYFEPPLAGELVPGNMLGPYVIQRKLGAGAMGEVWLAHDPVLERDLAIKIIPAHIAEEEVRRARFVREAKLAARLNDKNAVTVYQAGVQEDIVFIAMELVDGESLDKVVARDGLLDWHQATNVICDAARGLAAAHEIGLVHRDVKPANLMRTSKGVTKVVDFGLAREQLANTQFTQQGMLLGTPAYMAPEQWAGEKVDGRTDLYSLICTYYFLLTGQLPFEATNTAAMGYQHRYAPMPDPRQLCPDLPTRLSHILVRGAAKQPGDRYQTAAELIVDLESLLATPDAVVIVTSSSAGRTDSLPPRGHKRTLDAGGRARAWWFSMPPRVRWIFSACSAAPLLLLCGIIVLVPTPKGTVKIEIDDPRAIVLVDREKITVKRLGQPIELRTGEHELVVRRGDVVVETRDFKIVSGETTVVRITLLDDVVTRPTTDQPALNIAPFATEDAKMRQQRWAEYANNPVEVTNSIDMKLVLVPAGDFVMGSPETEESHSRNETQHLVRITKPFYIGAYEVTQAQYERVTGNNPSQFSGDWRRPVEQVTWDDAMEFCEKLSAFPAECASGRKYRLPTEAEWEYACRAGTTTAFHYGSSLSTREAKIFGTGSATVGSYAPNGIGLYDMHGNDQEWCADWYDAGYYATSDVEDPKGPSQGSHRVLRGGGWGHFAATCRSAQRNHDLPSARAGDRGFRVLAVTATPFTSRDSAAPMTEPR